jgi:hypothetical protein
MFMTSRKLEGRRMNVCQSKSRNYSVKPIRITGFCGSDSPHLQVSWVETLQDDLAFQLFYFDWIPHLDAALE